MRGPDDRWSPVCALVGLSGLLVLASALVQEWNGRLAQATGGALAIVALPLAWTLLGRQARARVGLWDRLAWPARATVTGALVLLGIASLIEALSTGSLVAAVVAAGTLGGLLVLAVGLTNLVDAIVWRFGAAWAVCLVEVTVLVASVSALAAVLIGGLVTPVPFPGFDDVAVVGMVWGPLVSMLVLVGHATRRAWQMSAIGSGA